MLPTTLRAGDVEVTVDADRGASLTSLRHAGTELLVTDGPPPFGSGSFVMAPWAGRIRDGIACWEDRERRFPRWHDGHALHGLVHDQVWRPVGPDAWTTTVGEDRWFAPLELTQTLELTPGALTLHLDVRAPRAPAPVTVGWHPWFRRRLAADAAPLELTLPRSRVLARDAAGIATADRVPVPARPWDDAFVDLTGPVELTWPGQLQLTVSSSAPTTVIYTEPDHALCVEPQSGPPDEVNGTDPRIVAPGAPLHLSTTWTFTSLT